MKTSLLKLTLGVLAAPLISVAQSNASASPSATATQPVLNDANIAAIVVAANDIDIKAGKLAVKTSKNGAVKGLGEMMVRDHEGVNQQAKALAKKLHVTPQDNDVSRKLKSDADQTYTNLQKKKGAEFDRAYVENEIAYHQAVIAAVDSLLLPSAQNAELKSLVQQVRPALQAHLEHAKHVQSQLK
jgi:putative membrane protein